MSRKYKCLTSAECSLGSHQLISIRDQDKYAIREWRNEQVDILRQKDLLTIAQQESYFRNIVDKLFETDQPDQLLFSFLEDGELVGYGGLVHIDWVSKNGEISFITETSRNKSIRQFNDDWSHYLHLLKVMVQSQLGFVKIYTYAYDIRPHLIEMLLDNNFREEARLKNHILVQGTLHDVLIHSYFFDDIYLKTATKADAETYFRWANDLHVRQNSFSQNPIEWDSHLKWFQRKLESPGCVLFIAYLNNQPVGQIRFDEVSPGDFEIDFSVDPRFRSRGLGHMIITAGSRALVGQKTVNSLSGKVKTGNKASVRSFERAGFRLASSSLPEVAIFRKDYSRQS
jgi:RimJ/RimL family protein N-acetyltransferase